MRSFARVAAAAVVGWYGVTYACASNCTPPKIAVPVLTPYCPGWTANVMVALASVQEAVIERRTGVVSNVAYAYPTAADVPVVHARPSLVMQVTDVAFPLGHSMRAVPTAVALVDRTHTLPVNGPTLLVTVGVWARASVFTPAVLLRVS